MKQKYLDYMANWEQKQRENDFADMFIELFRPSELENAQEASEFEEQTGEAFCWKEPWLDQEECQRQLESIGLSLGEIAKLAWPDQYTSLLPTVLRKLKSSDCNEDLDGRRIGYGAPAKQNQTSAEPFDLQIDDAAQTIRRFVPARDQVLSVTIDDARQWGMFTAVIRFYRVHNSKVSSSVYGASTPGTSQERADVAKNLRTKLQGLGLTLMRRELREVEK